jgi:hypothetical protein
MVLNSNTNDLDICEGFQCLKEAIYSVTEKLDNASITFRLCESCASNLSNSSISSSPTETKKEKLEQQVVRPGYSNTSSQIHQQHGVLLDD